MNEMMLYTLMLFISTIAVRAETIQGYVYDDKTNPVKFIAVDALDRDGHIIETTYSFHEGVFAFQQCTEAEKLQFRITSKADIGNHLYFDVLNLDSTVTMTNIIMCAREGGCIGGYTSWNDNEPVTNALIDLRGRDRGSLLNPHNYKYERGYFLINNLPPGKYELLISLRDNLSEREKRIIEIQGNSFITNMVFIWPFRVCEGIL